MVKYELSPTSLNLLEDCPRCFWLQLVKKVRRPNGAFPSLPSGIDKVLKAHFDGFRKEGKLPPELVKHKVKAKLFENMELLNLWKANRKGIRYQEDETGIVLRGAVDEILEKDGKLIVLDFKTRGFPLKEDTAHHYQDQLNIYNFLLRKNGYKTEDYAYLLFFHPKEIRKDGNFVFETNLQKMDINVGHAEKLFHKAVGVLSSAIPDPSQNCGFCEWRGKA